MNGGFKPLQLHGASSGRNTLQVHMNGHLVAAGRGSLDQQAALGSKFGALTRRKGQTFIAIGVPCPIFILLAWASMIAFLLFILSACASMIAPSIIGKNVTCRLGPLDGQVAAFDNNSSR